MNMEIREALSADLEDVLTVERAAFGSDEEAELVRALLEDSSARPVLSLLAVEHEQAVGHILFTAVHLIETPEEMQKTASTALLAPLAVVPTFQKQGVGTQLVERGFQLLSQSGVDLVFVLGSPDYYSRHGFWPAGALGFEAPYVLPEKWTEAWMVRSLTPNLIGNVSGKVICADAISKPEFWQE
ncbi:MAG: N-acetyltransferase [Cyanobacteria bacterium J06621_11]